MIQLKNAWHRTIGLCAILTAAIISFSFVSVPPANAVVDGLIEGKVVDADGQPISGISVDVLTLETAAKVPIEGVRWWEALGRATTNLDGSFSMTTDSSLPVKVLFSDGYSGYVNHYGRDRQAGTFIQEWYGDQADVDFATIVSTEPGEVKELGEIEMDRAHLETFAQESTPKVGGTPEIGSNLLAVTGDWSPAPDMFVYTWLMDGKHAPWGMSEPTYKPRPEYAGRSFSVRITAVKQGYHYASKTSLPVVVTQPNFVESPTPQISGEARVGETLTVNPGVWSPTPTLKFDWYRSGTRISGTSNYVLTDSDAGHQIHVTATAYKVGYNSQTRESLPTAVVAGNTPALPVEVAAKPVTFGDEDGTAEDAYTIPSVDGLEYLIHGEVVSAGTYPATGTISVTVRARADYVLDADAVSAWSHTFKVTPYEVVPEPVLFDGEDGTYTVPQVEGVRYLVEGKVTEAGTYTAAVGKLTVTAEAETDYRLTGTTTWSHTFEAKATPSIVPGDLVAFDPWGRLWNYGHTGSTSARAMIGRSGWTAMDEIHTVDWNSDGYVDIIAKSKTGQLYYYKAHAAGGFSRYVIGSSGWGSYDLTVSKWKSADKYPSIIAKNSVTGKLYVYGNNSGYRLSARYILGNSGWSRYVLTAMDWDQDGRKDIVAKTSAGQLKLYRGNGTGKFMSGSPAVIGRSGWNSMSNIVSSSGYSGEGTNGLVARDSSGRLWYYQAENSRWASRRLLGTGWGRYHVAGQ